MMTIQDNTVVTVTYVLREKGPHGPSVEVVDRQYPFRFLFGQGKLLPAFEAQLEGKTPGDTFNFTLTPEEGYGPYLENEIVDVPMEIFNNSSDELKELIRIGYYLTLTDSKGQQRNGKVLAVGGETVRMDFNHAMAGKTLHFEGTVLEVREARQEEVNLGQPIQG